MNSPRRHIRLRAICCLLLLLAGSLLMSSCWIESTGETISDIEFLDVFFLALFLMAGLVPTSGQNLVSKDFQVAATQSYVSNLQRQTDGSFTQWQYLANAPYSLIGSTPDVQSSFSNASFPQARPFKNVAGWQFLSERMGVPIQSVVFANLLGNGTPVGLSFEQAGFDGASTTATSLMVVVFNPDGTTKTPNFYSVPANPVGILVGDFNHDGKDDVVVVGQNTSTPTGWTNNSIAVYLGNGDGTLQAPLYCSGHNGTYNAVAYDFNADGNLDLAVVNANSGDVSILLGKGDGTFNSPVNYTALAQPTGIVAGDFNGDGYTDLAVSSATAISVLPGKSKGVFGAPIGPTGTFTAINGLAAGDFNKDGKLDLAVSDSTNATVSILLGDGTGHFPNENDYAAGYGIVSSNILGSLYAMDLDGDGNLDVVIASGHPDMLAGTNAVTAFFGRGDGTLIGPPAYRVGTGLNALAVADLNGDGKPDIAAASGTVWILLSSGGGNFTTPVSIGLGSGVSASGIAAADLRGVGKQDLVVGDFNGSGVYVLLNNGNGTFQAPVPYAVGGKVTSIAIGDFNGDGKLDIAVCGASYNTGATAGILLGKGDGTFQPIANLSGTANPVSLTAGDFNNDGVSDLAIADQGTWPSDYSLPSGGGVVVYLSDGKGGFQSPVTYTAGIDASFVVAADVNGDHAPDLIVGTLDPNWNTNYQSDVAVLLGNVNGTFNAASYIATEESPNAIAVADFNGDGKPDLAIAHCCSLTFATLMLGNGNGTFQTEGRLLGANSPSAIAAADLLGNGRQDIIAGLSQYHQSAVAIFANAGIVLSSIAVTPAAPSIVVGATQQFAATGTYTDGSTKVLTSQATWASASTGVATVSSVGLATSVTVGASTISATFGGVTGSAVLTVTPLSACDVMQNGRYSVAEVQRMINEALGAFSPKNDLNADGKIDVADVQIVMSAVMGMACMTQ